MEFALELKMSDSGLVCNAPQLQAVLKAELHKYNYIVDESNIGDAKKHRTALNNLEKRIKETRKKFEENELEDWKKAKKTIMDCEKLIKSASDELGVQINQLEEIKKLQKMEEVRKAVVPMITQIMQHEVSNIQFEQLYDRKEFDKNSMTVPKIIDAIGARLTNLQRNWDLFKVYLAGTSDDVKEFTYAKFTECLDTGLTKVYLDDLLSKQKLAQMRREQIQTTSQTPQQVQTVQDDFKDTSNKVVARYIFEVYATQEMRNDLNVLFEKHKPQYRMIEREDFNEV